MSSNPGRRVVNSYVRSAGHSGAFEVGAIQFLDGSPEVVAIFEFNKSLKHRSCLVSSP